jgi:hypothetical protein
MPLSRRLISSTRPWSSKTMARAPTNSKVRSPAIARSWPR